MGGGAPAIAVVDAFCVYSMPEDHPAVHLVRRRGLPVVFVDEPLDPAAAFVGIDDHDAARTAAAHALELGHTRLSVLTTRGCATTTMTAQ